jgi:ABC-type sugar transport system substrate-binding protein
LPHAATGLQNPTDRAEETRHDHKQVTFVSWENSPSVAISVYIVCFFHSSWGLMRPRLKILGKSKERQRRSSGAELRICELVTCPEANSSADRFSGQVFDGEQAGGAMRRFSFLLSLLTDKNDYQREQATVAQETAQELGVEVKILFADNDAITQSQQLLGVIQSCDEHPDGIICQPAGTGLAQVAAAAARAGIGWAVLNREVDYLAQLRTIHRVPLFSVGADQEEVGRIQGRQFAVLAPEGGIALYLMGPAVNPTVKQRLKGVEATKPQKLQIRTMRGHWTEESGYEAISAWLRLSTSHQTPVSIVGAQNDSMALGARRAFEENTAGEERERWAKLPYLGCDAVRSSGRQWVQKGLLAASVVIPATTGLALEIFTRALQTGTQPPEGTLSRPASFPAIGELALAKAHGSAGQP